MTDFSHTHVAMVRDGSYDPYHCNPCFVAVQHDQKTDYYEFPERDADTLCKFVEFVALAWGIECDMEPDLCEYGKGFYVVDVDSLVAEGTCKKARP